jgi:hypothetical protein
MLRHKLIAGLSVLALVGGGSGVAVALNGASAARSNRDHSSRCPKALPSGSQAYFSVARAIRHEIPRVFPNRPRQHFSNRGYTVWAALSLWPRGGGGIDVGFPRPQLVKKAAEACGSQVAQRSWAVAIDFPGAPAATLGTYIVYLARTRAGWRIWYEWASLLQPTRILPRAIAFASR